MNAREAIEDMATRSKWTFTPWEKVIAYPNGTKKVTYTRGRFFITVHYSRANTVLDATLYMSGMIHAYAPTKGKRAWVRSQIAKGREF